MQLGPFLLGLIIVTVMSTLSACGSQTPTATSAPTTAPTAVVRAPVAAPSRAESRLPTPTIGATGATGATPNSTPHYTYEVVNVFPHDPDAFTQGLLFNEGMLYEGTGLYGQSSLRRVDLGSGAVLALVTLPESYFGEGITIVGDKVYQLTWREGTGFIYHKESFELQQQFTYTTEGWGITYDGARLIMSDGSAKLSFWDPDSLAELGTVEVHDETGPIVRLNELEYIEGEIFANIWQTDRIARIEPTTGEIIGWIDLSGLLSPTDRTAATDVLNGIAYLPESKRLFVTGKLWPKLFEIRLLPIK